MDSLFHFLFPLIAVFAARIHLKHGIPTILGLAFIAVFIDLDIFLIHRASLHNLFITLLLPVILVILAFKFGKEDHRQLTIAIFLFLISHVILDLFNEGAVALFYPLTLQVFSINAELSVLQGTLISSNGIGLLLYFGIILLCLFLEQIDFFILKKHDSLKKALKNALKTEKRKIKRNI